MNTLGYVYVVTGGSLVKFEGRPFLNVTSPEMFFNNYEIIFFSNTYGILATSDPRLLKVNQLFTLDANFSTPSTANELGTGLGLVLCNEFVSRSNGSIHVESELEKGQLLLLICR